MVQITRVAVKVNLHRYFSMKFFALVTLCKKLVLSWALLLMVNVKLNMAFTSYL